MASGSDWGYGGSTKGSAQERRGRYQSEGRGRSTSSIMYEFMKSRGGASSPTKRG